MQDPRGRTPETVWVLGSAITRVAVYADQDETLLNAFCFGTARIGTVQVSAFSGDMPVGQTRVQGLAGDIASAVLEVDWITAVELSAESAALIDLCTVPVSQEATVGWEQIPDFPYPMRLPVTHLSYPCTPGMNEDLARARDLARQRIRYGDPQQFTALPVLIPTDGTIAVTNGSPIVVGAGTTWTDDLVGAILQIRGDLTAYAIIMVVAPNKLVLSRGYGDTSRSGAAYTIGRDTFGQLYNYLVQLVAGGSAAGPMKDRSLPMPVATTGTVAVTSGSQTVMGTGTAWRTDLTGLTFALAGEQAAYTIVTVDTPTQLTLDRGYVGTTEAGKSYVIAARLQPRAPGGVTPRMPNQSPLDLVLLGTLHPAIAQMVGLYWTDQKAAPQTSYDYLIVADREGLGGLDPVKILSLLQQSGFSHLDGYIVFNQQMVPASPLPAPAGLRVYALPGSSRRTPSGAIQEASNNAGLRWELDVTDLGTLLPGRAIMYHLWRADLGNGATPTAPGRYNLLTKDRPVLVAEPPLGQTPQRASNWPPFPLHAIDSALPGGWYSYQVSGIDIFGRHSPNSGAGPWYQWLPVPDPRPRYYKDPPGNTSIHPFAAQLLDETLPPSLTGIEAYALDPADPTVLRDAAYTAWWNALTASPWYQALSQEAKRNFIGLRVRWLWTAAQMQQAPDTREFRIYYHAGQMNALLGRTLRVSAVNSTESEVETDIPNTQPANVYAGLWLRVGTDAFAVVASQAGSPLRVRVRNIGPYNDMRPRATASCTLAIPSRYAAGTVAVTNGSRTVMGTGTTWNPSLAGMLFQVAGEQTVYTVSAVASPTQLTLDRSYGGMTAAGKAYAIRYPLFVDYSVPTTWQERYYVVGYDEHVAVTTDAAGQPLRKYEVFLPAAGDAYHVGLPLSPSLAEPIVYAHIGVSAADNKTSTPDDPKWAAGRWGGRAGHEGRIGPPATVFRVRRELPPAPTVPPTVSDAVRATAADYQGRSFYTYRWRPVAGLQTHIFRALDDALFKVDWSQRPRPGLDASQVQFFPDTTAEPRWDNAKRQQVATELNALNGFGHDAAGSTQAMAYYRGLSNDALRVMAGLPGNERAFTQLTAQPLDPDDPANADRRGPNDPDTYTSNPDLCAYMDTLAGLSTNRYFYRAIYVDGAHNRGPFSLSSPSVWLPNVVPPRAPSLTKALGGDRQITLRWASNREPDLVEYRVYRADSEESARNQRLMTHMYTEVVAAGDPMARPAEVSWTDRPVAPFQTFFYRVTAVDDASNQSIPSAVVRGRAYREDLPDAPEWISGTHQVVGGATVVQLVWTLSENLAVLVQRQPQGSMQWSTLGTWLPAGTTTFDDTTADPTEQYTYRLRSRDSVGTLSDVSDILGVPPV
jgi:hypothetical protein